MKMEMKMKKKKREEKKDICSSLNTYKAEERELPPFLSLYFYACINALM
jgi:hypothetical protein